MKLDDINFVYKNGGQFVPNPYISNAPKQLGFYRLSKEVIPPTYATEKSAAFDLRVFLDGTAVEYYEQNNGWHLQAIYQPADKKFIGGRWLNQPIRLSIPPQCRMKIPTGLIFDIPEGYWMSVNMRGGTAYKKGLSLANDTGIIDEDYVKETFVVVFNTTSRYVDVENGERIAQAKLERCVPTALGELELPPVQKTTRAGGFNSTGIM